MIKKIFFLLCISFTINFAFARVYDFTQNDWGFSATEMAEKQAQANQVNQILDNKTLSIDERLKQLNNLGFPVPVKKASDGRLVGYFGTKFMGMTYQEALNLDREHTKYWNDTNNDNKPMPVDPDANNNTNGSSGGAQTTPPNNNNQGGSNTGTQLNQPSNNNWSGANSNGGINWSNAGAQKIATAFTFGMTGVAFTILPFLFVCLTGYFRAKSGHNAQSISMTSTFGFAFIVHTFACVLFTLGIKCLDILSKIANESDYFSNKIFSIFWARSESAVYSLAGASGTIEDRGAYLELFIVQTAVDWLFIFLPILSFMTGFGYAMIELKQNRVEFNALSAISWSIGAGIISSLIYFAWAKIASIALFIPNSDILEFTKKLFDEILTI